MKRCADQYIFVMDLDQLGYQNFDLRNSSKMIPIINVSKIYTILCRGTIQSACTSRFT